MKVVIMAGGKGNRFWPRSTEHVPKQFLALTSTDTMLQETYRRFLRWIPAEDIYVATVHKYTQLVLEQLKELDLQQLIVEPQQRDTAPCMALIARHFLRKGQDEPFVSVPSDHHIEDDKAFLLALEQAAEAARQEHAIAILGMIPTRPEIGFGYIEAIGKVQEQDGGQTYRVKRFIEKPDLETAKKLVNMEHVYWNCGIVAWRPSTIAACLERFEPELRLLLSLSDEQVKQLYPLLPKVSLDYAILEKADLIYCIPVRFDWDDVGTWTALTRLYPSDEQGNLSSGSVHAHHASDNIVFSEKPKNLVIGVEGLIIVSTPEGLLVCPKSEEQTIKQALLEMESIQEHGKSS